MPKFITVLVEGQQELVNVDHIQRVRPAAEGGTCQLIFGGYSPDFAQPGGDFLLISEPYTAITKRITQAHG